MEKESAYCTRTVEAKPFEDLSRPDGLLNMHSFLPMSLSHGPGRRAIVWLQGCLQRCPGCINPAMLDAAKTVNLMDPEELAERVAEAKQSALDIEGVTIQGGEPMLQAKNVAAFVRRLKELDPGLNVLVFSGYTEDELQSFNSEGVNDLLSLTDVLIDGAFVKEKFDRNRIAGSTNQNIIHMNGRRLEGRDFSRRGNEMVIQPNTEEQIRTGVPLPKPEKPPEAEADPPETSGPAPEHIKFHYQNPNL